MSYEAFRAAATIYNGQSSESNIRLGESMKVYSQVVYGASAPRKIHQAESYLTRNTDEIVNFVGIWAVREADDTEAMHVLRSDNRKNSGVSHDRFPMSAIEIEDGLRILPGACEGEDITLSPSMTHPTIGGMAVVPLAEDISQAA